MRSFIGFDRVQLSNGKFRSFWSLDSGWGVFEMKRNQVELRVLYGELCLQTLKLPSLPKMKVKSVSLSGKTVPFTQIAEGISFRMPVRIPRNDSVKVSY